MKSACWQATPPKPLNRKDFARRVGPPSFEALWAGLVFSHKMCVTVSPRKACSHVSDPQHEPAHHRRGTPPAHHDAALSPCRALRRPVQFKLEDAQRVRTSLATKMVQMQVGDEVRLPHHRPSAGTALAPRPMLLFVHGFHGEAVLQHSHACPCRCACETMPL